MRVYIVRHGQTAWNVEGRAQGHTDVPLDLTGLRQAERLGKRLAGLDVARILCSDLTRCIQTAEPTASALGLELELREDLRERGFGKFEGRLFSEFKSQQRQDPGGYRPPGGESFEDVWKRLKDVCDEIRSMRENVLVFTHGGTGGLLLARLLRGTVLTSKAFRFDNTAVTTLERRADDGLFMISRYNDASHVEDEDSPSVISK